MIAIELADIGLIHRLVVDLEIGDRAGVERLRPHAAAATSPGPVAAEEHELAAGRHGIGVDVFFNGELAIDVNAQLALGRAGVDPGDMMPLVHLGEDFLGERIVLPAGRNTPRCRRARPWCICPDVP